jgi:hypothetical protein
MIHPHVFQKLSVGIPMMDRFVGPAHKVSREMANFVNEMLAVKIHAMLESIVMIPILHPSLDVDRALKDTGGMASHVSQQLVNRDLHLVSRFEKKPIFKYFGCDDSPNASLRSAFLIKNFKKNFKKFQKKNSKKNSNFFHQIFFPFFFWISRFHIQFGVGLQKLGGLGTLVWPPKGSQQTVLKG